MAADDDRKALLDALKIDRNTVPEESGQRWLWWLGALVLISLVGVVWFAGFSGNSGVTVKTVVASAISQQPGGNSVLDATGYIVARRQATVSSKATGKVVEVLIEEGLLVEQDQLLARLDDSIPRAQYALAESQLRSAEASLAELQVALRQAQLDLERTQNLTERNLASQANLDKDLLSVEALDARLEKANKDIEVAQRLLAVQKQILDDMQIRAPFAGVVIAKAAQPGEMISPVSAGGGFTRTGICTIVDMNSLEVEVDVNESYINRVYAQQPVQVTLNAYPDVQFPAEVIAIIPAADRNKATVRVRVGLLERDAKVLPDMGVRVAFLEEQAATDPAVVPQGVLVPQAAVSNDAMGQFVYVLVGEHVERRAVGLGKVQGTRVNILTGVVGGERLVTPLNAEMLAQLSDGARVTVSR